jgi:hypothetical protein
VGKSLSHEHEARRRFDADLLTFWTPVTEPGMNSDYCDISLKSVERAGVGQLRRSAFGVRSSLVTGRASMGVMSASGASGLRPEKCASAECPYDGRFGSGDSEAGAPSVGPPGSPHAGGETAPQRIATPAAHFST